MPLEVDSHPGSGWGIWVGIALNQMPFSLFARDLIHLGDAPCHNRAQASRRDCLLARLRFSPRWVNSTPSQVGYLGKRYRSLKRMYVAERVGFELGYQSSDNMRFTITYLTALPRIIPRPARVFSIYSQALATSGFPQQLHPCDLVNARTRADGVLPRSRPTATCTNFCCSTANLFVRCGAQT